MVGYSKQDQTRRFKKEKLKSKDVYKQARENSRDKKTGLLRCAMCLQLGKDDEMVIDHIKTRGAHPELILDLDNLQILHTSCHAGKHSQ